MLEVITLLANLTQVGLRVMTEVNNLSALIAKANAEGRDLTDAELDAARKIAADAIARLN